MKHFRIFFAPALFWAVLVETAMDDYAKAFKG